MFKKKYLLKILWKIYIYGCICFVLRNVPTTARGHCRERKKNVLKTVFVYINKHTSKNCLQIASSYFFALIFFFYNFRTFFVTFGLILCVCVCGYTKYLFSFQFLRSQKNKRWQKCFEIGGNRFEGDEINFYYHTGTFWHCSVNIKQKSD